jgi:hypothetical protein
MNKQTFIKVCLVAAIFAVGMITTAQSATVAYWRFEAGPVDTQVPKPAPTGYNWYPSVPDSSGSGNELTVWDEGGAGYRFRNIVAYSPVPLTRAANTLSVKNSGGGPAMWTNPADPISTMTPAQWTVEVTFKLENGGYRCIVGRDSRGAATKGLDTNQALSAMYFQAIPNNGLAIKFVDVDGYWHDAISANNVFQSFDYPSNNDGTNVPWYSAAAVSDGTLLKLYLFNHSNPSAGYVLIAQDNMVTDNPGSTNTALSAGLGSAGDWMHGCFTVGRGLYNGGHTDRAYGFIDEVRISNVALPVTHFLQGGTAYDPAPAQTADTVNSDVDVTLNWKAAVDPNFGSGNDVNPAIVDQYVFMRNAASADPNLYYLGATGVDPANTPASSYGPINLAFDSIYQWVVVEALDGFEQTLTAGVSSLGAVDPNNIVGNVWTLNSIPSIPVITTQPAGVLANAGDSAVFTVVADSISTAHYAWWKSTDKANNTATDEPVGTDSATLTLSSVSASNEGFYYCKVTNGSGTTVTSDVAFLEVKRLVAWYAFENNIADSSGNGNNGTAIKADANVPFNYAAGKVSQAISLNGTDEAVQIPRTIQNSMTIELWVKTIATGGIGNGWFDGRGLVDGELTTYERNDFGTSLRGSNFCFGVGNIAGNYNNAQSTTAINDGQWHYCVATRDHVTGQIAVYVDGEQEASVAAPLGAKDEPTVLRIGSIQTGVNFLAGQIDEVKLYNYPLAEMTVASQYYTVSGQKPCVLSLKPDLAYDLNGDCAVNLGDFAMFAAAWLDCGLYPNCQ